MKILLDENFPEGFKRNLSKNGHDVKHINQVRKGMTDKEVFEFSIKEKRIIISNDIDFKQLFKNEHFGIIKFNSNSFTEDGLLNVLRKYKPETIKNVYIEFNKKGIFEHKKVYSKKGKFKQIIRIPLNLT